MSDRIDLMVEMIDKLTGPAQKMGRSLNTLKSRVSGLGMIASTMSSRIAGISAAVQGGFSNSVFGNAARSVISFGQTTQAAIGITALRARQGLGRIIGQVTSFGSDFGTALKKSQVGQAASIAFGGLQSAVAPPLKRAGAAVQQFAARAQMNVGLAGLKIKGAMQTAGSAVAGMASRAGPQLSDLAQRFAGAAKNATLLVAVVGVALVGAFAAAIGKAVVFRDTTLRGLTVITGSAQKAGEAFDEAMNLSDRLGTGPQKTIQGIQGLLAKGFDLGGATDVFKGLADLKVAVPTANLENALLAIEQIKAKGVLSMEELQQQLAESGLNTAKVLEAIGAKMGKSAQEVRKMISAGEISGDLGIQGILDSITGMTGKPLGKVAEEASMGLGGLIDRFKQLPERFTTELSTRIDASGASDTLGDLWKAVGPDSKLFNDALDLAVSTIKTVTPMVQAFGSSLSAGFKEAWPAIKAALDMLFSGFSKVGGGPMQTVKDLGKVLGKVAAFAVGLAVVFGGMVVAGIQLAVMAINGIIGAWDWLIAAIGKVAFAIDDFIMNIGAKWERLKTDALAAGAALVQGLINGIKAGVGMVADAARGLANSVMGALDSVFKFGSPSKTMAKLGAFASEGFEVGLAPLDGLNPLAGVDPSLPALDPLAGLGGLEKTNPLAGITPPVNDNAAAWGERPMAGPVSGVGAGAQAGAAAAAGQGGGIGSVNFAPVFNVQQQPGQDGAALANDLEQRMRGEFNAMLEEMALETGS